MMARFLLVCVFLALLRVAIVSASSHSEVCVVRIDMQAVCMFRDTTNIQAPGTAKKPQQDQTDLYAFMGYEPGREEFVNLIMNIQPLQVMTMCMIS